MRSKIYWIAVGGCAFWLPALILFAAYPRSISPVALNLASLTGLALLGLASLAIHKDKPRWGWVLAGVYILGPAAMFLTSTLDRTPSPTSLPGDWIWLLTFCLLPPM